jgi:hypothetical protein
VRSRFTRAQRVTVCMATLYLFFLADAMFYGTSEETIPDPYFTLAGMTYYKLDIKTKMNLLLPFTFIGVLHFDSNSIAVGIIVSFIVFPPIVLAVLFFKKARVFKMRKNRVDLGLDKGMY